MHLRSQQGRGGEAEVARYLTQHGFYILAFNYAKSYGEIDLIAQKDSLLVFVEVKMRSTTVEHWAELITPSKQKKIGMVAKEYIATHRIHDMDCRFDVAFVQGQGESAQVTYIEDAFWGE